MNVKTSITYQPIDKPEFPSITFCSSHPFKRSQIGNYSLAFLVLAQSLARDQLEMHQLQKANRLSCKSDIQSPTADVLEKYSADFMNGSLSPEFFFDKILSPLFTKFQTDVEKCWINGFYISCESILTNRASDDSICFTYNYGTEVAKLVFNTSFANPKGEIENMKPSFAKLKEHPKTVRFLLKSNQSDYCGTAMIRCGAGYTAMLTERDSTSFSMFSTPLYLSPGFINTVIIKTIKYKRNTEHMRLCRSVSNVFLMPTAEKYMQSMCYFQCIIGAMLKQCKCYPQNQIVLHNLFLKNTKNFNVSEKDVNYCNGETVMCARDVQSKVIDDNINKICPHCQQQCDENKYDYLLTRLPMSANHLRKQIPENLAGTMNDQQLKRNYIDVAFSFENNYIEVVEESQAITITDLFINLGNNIGLFLGMSFMSAFEVTNELFLPLLLNLIDRIWRPFKMKIIPWYRSNSIQAFFQKRG